MRREYKVRVWRCIAFVGLFLCFLLGLGVGAYAQNANDILGKAAAAYENSNGISASFTMFTRSAGQNAGESFEGTIQMKGDKFTLVTPEALTWFNGTTQWTYVERNDEVNVTNPTGEELQFTNPALLLNSYKKGFTAAYKGESTAPNGKAAYDVELTPKKKGDIVKVELQIEKYSNFPARITVTSKNGVSSTIQISQLKTGINQPDRFFVFNEGGYTAAIYASRANLSPVLYEGIQPGGQLTTTTEVENFPGYPDGITGPELMEDLKKQAVRFGADIRFGIATAADLGEAPYKITIDGEKVIETETLIIATGASAKYLGLPDEHKYAGMGVSACATCDGFFYRKKTVAVVGGGDTACEEAIYLAGLAKQVYLIVRKPYLRASKVMQERVFKTPNITVLFEHNTLGLFGENGVEGAHLVKRMGEPDEEKVDIAIDGFFLAIGHKPNSDIFKPWVDTDEVGYIVTVPGTPRTKVLGVFAAGDVADPHYRQAITAAGSGCKAAIEAERYLSEIGK